MNKYSKIGLTALAGSLVAGSVSAATLSASGSAAIYFSGGDDNKIKVTVGQWLTQLLSLLLEM